MVSHIGGGSDSKQVGSPVDVNPLGKVTKIESIDSRAQHQTESEKVLTVKEAKELTNSMNKFLESVETELKFQMHDELHEYYVTIVDSKTDEVIREIPSKKLMDIHAEMRKFLGLLIDRKI